ncbi:MAG: T9SS type A sorting domain-containing protein [Bacteroidales bacterium]|nr:T9SS type A sorting domain-containing protein [Bacteroidales bacterium]
MKTNTLNYPAIVLTGILLILVSFTISDFMAFFNHAQFDKRNRYETFLLKEYRQAPKISQSNGENEDKAMDQPDAAAFQEYLMTMDPETKRVPRERLLTAYKQTKAIQSQKSTSSLSWEGTGTEMGGRTRAILYDPNDPNQKKVWAGGVTGGLWYNNDITNQFSSWVPVGDFWPILSIRCITYDPNNSQVFYIGTGEPETALITYRESSGLGQGIWRSEDGGQTWNQIPSTSNFVYITDILVRDENGTSVIYAGVVSGEYHGTHQSLPSDGLYRSVDNGVTWEQVLPDIYGSNVPYAPADIEQGADGRIYIGSRPNLDDEGGATILYSDSGLPGSWVVNEDYKILIENNPVNPLPGRVILASAKSDENVVYALVASGKIKSENNFRYFYCYYVLRSDDKGVTWTEKSLPADLTNGENFATIAWHALDAAVDPNNPDNLFIGGLDMHHSTNGGTTWYRVSDWSKMYSGGGSDYIHADQHTIVYKPGSSQEILFGTDGGVFYTYNGIVNYPAFEQRNNGYNTLQFYTCAINPTASAVSYLGGLQDNGTLYYSGNPLTLNDMWTGGDGAYCFFDEDGASLSVTSYYYNQYSVFMNGNWVNSLNNWSSGTFVCPADFDYRRNAIYANAVDFVGNFADHILRLTNITGNEAGNYLNMGTGSNLYFSAVTYSPYSTAAQTNLIIGNQQGRVFRVEGAEATPDVTEIGSPNFPVGNISCLAIGGSEDTLVATFSNYGVPSVWVTGNGGQSWTDVETNLPDMPVRWAIFHPQNSHQVMLATETGTWTTDDIFANPVVWEPATDGMANVRVDMVRIRKSDNIVLAASHGRGLFTSDGPWDVVTGTRELSNPLLAIYPNPSAGNIHVSFDLPGQAVVDLSVVNGKGQIILSEKVSSNGTFRKQLNLVGQPAGVYFLKLETGGKVIASEKLILM